LCLKSKSERVEGWLISLVNSRAGLKGFFPHNNFFSALAAVHCYATDKSVIDEREFVNFLTFFTVRIFKFENEFLIGNY
jgi:hypothetical protein